MTRLVLLCFLITLCACRRNDRNPPLTNSRDTIIKNYFQVIDSLPYYDTLDKTFKLLKAYYSNDTGYLVASYREVADLLKHRGKALMSEVCEQPPPINTLGFDEVYRFSYNAAFCNKSVTLTVGEVSDSVLLEVYLYEMSDREATCKTISHTTKLLNKSESQKINIEINYADFWGLQADNGMYGFDGSSLFVTGYERPIKAFQGKYKTIYRWSAERTALGVLFKKLLDLSRTTVDCFHYE
jgi:hypothetical protein